MKQERIKSRAFLEYVASMDCCVKDISCQGHTQPHHLLKPWIGSRGMGMRADDRNAIPLCYFHHAQLHQKFVNESKFFERYFRNADFGKKLAQNLWHDFNCK